jgi:hypothetical protein
LRSIQRPSTEPSPLQHESELDEELSRGREVVNHDADVLHPLTVRCSMARNPIRAGVGAPRRGGSPPGVLSADLLDDLNQLVRPIALTASELDELARLLHDGSALGRAGHRDAAPAAELE